MNRLQGKKALITGGSSGIGLATAKLFIAEGATVAVTALSDEELFSAAKQLEGVLCIQMDVLEMHSIEAAMAKVKEVFGSLDVLHVNAAISLAPHPFDRVPEDDFDKIMGVNFKGPYYTLQYALKAGLLGEGSSVVFTSSFIHRLGEATLTVYAASKAAICSLVRSASAGLTPRKIRVNSVSPGPVDTPMLDCLKEVMPPEVAERLLEVVAEKIPMKRVGKPEEVAEAVLFLASDASAFITGADLPVDGGMLAHPV